MESIVTPALVLREVKYQEADKILTLLTPQHGVITAMAKGSLRLKNKLFSACGLFCYSEFSLLPGRNMYRVEEASVNKVFHGITRSIESTALAMYMAEIVTTLSPTGTEAQKMLNLTLNCLYLLSEKRAFPTQVKAVFELRAMSECGFLPKLLCCEGCGKYDGDDFYLDAQSGHLLCAACARKQGHEPTLCEGALFALRHICLVEDKKIFAFRASPEALEDLARVAEHYALVHLDKPLKSYSFLKTVL